MKLLRQFSLVALSFCLSFGALAQPAIGTLNAAQHAGLVSTEELARHESTTLNTAQVRAQLREALVRQDAVEQMHKYGVTPEAAQARIDALTDEEAMALSEKMAQAPAGGSDILGILFTVFLILLITDILGLTKIFPFTRSIR